MQSFPKISKNDSSLSRSNQIIQDHVLQEVHDQAICNRIIHNFTIVANPALITGYMLEKNELRNTVILVAESLRIMKYIYNIIPKRAREGANHRNMINIDQKRGMFPLWK